MVDAPVPVEVRAIKCVEDSWREKWMNNSTGQGLMIILGQSWGQYAWAERPWSLKTSVYYG